MSFAKMIAFHLDPDKNMVTKVFIMNNYVTSW